MDDLRKKETSKKQRIFALAIVCLSMIYFPISNFLKGEGFELIPIILILVLAVGVFIELLSLRRIKEKMNGKE